MSRPRVSVLLPVRDAQSTLVACLRSVRRQTLQAFECIMVDDGSRDASLAVGRAFAESDPRFRVVAAPRRGLVDALNTGIECCRAPWVARMDADDLMHRERLRVQVDALEASPALAGAGCHVRVFPRANLAEGLRAYEAWLRSIRSAEDLRREAFVECPIPHPTWMLRRSCLAMLGYRDRGWPEDYDLLLRVLARGEAVGVVPRRLLAWRDRPSRLWRTGPSYGLDRFLACKAAFLAEGFLRASPHYTLWGYGETGKALRRALLLHGKSPSLLVELHPGRIGERIHGAPVVAPEALETAPRQPIVVSVAGAGPRSEIRAALAAMGFRELSDFLCAA